MSSINYQTNMVLYSADTIQKEVSILRHILIHSYIIIILKN